MKKIFLLTGLSLLLAAHGRGGETASPENDSLLLKQVQDTAKQIKGVEASVRNGVVTLEGTVNSVTQKKFLEGQIGQINGVMDINNNLTVKTDTIPEAVGAAPQSTRGHQQSDEPLLKQVRAIANKSKGVEIHVQNGVVTLDGNVNSDAEKKILEARIGQLDGVLDINNNLKVISP